MSRFGDIHFDECNEEYGEGLYDGRKFIVLPEEKDEQGNVADCIVEGHFSDDERLFVWTQWELQSVVHRIMQVDSFADMDDLSSPAGLTDDEHEEWLDQFLELMQGHIIGVLSETVLLDMIAVRLQSKELTILMDQLQQMKQERDEYKTIGDGYAVDIRAAHAKWLELQEELRRVEKERDAMRSALKEVLCRADHIPLVTDYVRHFLSLHPVQDSDEREEDEI